MFGTPASKVFDTKLTLEQAREITEMYCVFVKSDHFVDALDAELKQTPDAYLDADQDPNESSSAEPMNPHNLSANLARSVAHAARTRAVMRVLSNALLPLFEEYDGFKGEEGFFLMNIALNDHQCDEVVSHNMNTISIVSLVQAGLYTGDENAQQSQQPVPQE